MSISDRLHGFNIILASSSPRRIKMFHDHGILPVVIPSLVEETIPMALSPVETTLFLALKKALSVKRQGLSPSGKGIIIAGDTIVYQDEILGKPVDREDAFRILSKLNGKEHRVITGMALLRSDIPKFQLFSEESVVTFHTYTTAELEDYLDTPEPYDKAGAYAIQGAFGKYVKEFDGDRNNIIGLPWEALMRHLIQFIS